MTGNGRNFKLNYFIPSSSTRTTKTTSTRCANEEKKIGWKKYPGQTNEIAQTNDSNE